MFFISDISYTNSLLSNPVGLFQTVKISPKFVPVRGKLRKFRPNWEKLLSPLYPVGKKTPPIRPFWTGGRPYRTSRDRVISILRHKLKINQWKNTSEVLEWFSSIKNKHSYSFVQLDIKELLLMKKTSEFVKSHTAITDKESRTILHCRKSRLLHEY